MKQKINDIKKITKEKKKQNAGSASTKLCLKHPYIPTRQKKGGKQSFLSLHCGGRHIVIDPLIAFRSWRRCTVL